MSAEVGTKSIERFQQILGISRYNFLLLNLCKALVTSGLVLYAFILFHSYNTNPHCQTSQFISPLQPPLKSSPTNITHLVFGISGSIKAWPSRKSYVEAWWKPNITRGRIFLDKDPTPNLLPWPPSSPPFCVSEDTTKLSVYPKHIAPPVIRIVRVILEIFREEDKEVRWYVLGDDDTIFFVENLAELLGNFDHTRYYYIGSISECTKSNFDFSFQMAFGGGGFALSYPLAADLVKGLDKCIERYPYFHVSDQILMSCIADLGVSLTQAIGFHQIDLVGDISGLLSSHPQSPLLSLHHLDIVSPIFPAMNSHESINHLMKPVEADHSRVLQQTICYDKRNNWTFSLAWGYTTSIYEQIHPKSFLNMPLETFRPWSNRARPPLYMFNTRWPDKNPCSTPHVFFLESVGYNVTEGDQIVTSYVRSGLRGLPACGNNSADNISKVVVFSTPSKLRKVDGSRCECCDVQHFHADVANVTEIKFRECVEDEIFA